MAYIKYPAPFAEWLQPDLTTRHWVVVTPFLRRKEQPWIHQAVDSDRHAFTVVPADYAHDRSRRNTSPRQWLDFLRHALRAWRASRRGEPGRVGFVTAFPQLAVCIGLLKRLTGSKAPVVAWFFNLGRAYHGARRAAAAYCLAGVDVFIVHSRPEIATYADMLGLPRERFMFVPFTEELQQPAFAEDRDDPYIVAMGTANRDYRTLIEAVRGLGHRTIIVAQPHAVEGIDLPPCVTVRTGLTLAACHELCQRARLNVVPLDNDETASGQVTLRDAMMFGRAVVATRSIGTADYLDDGVTGLLVPPRDVDAMAAAIETLWHDARRRTTLGAAARAWVLRNASFETGPQRMFEILEQVRIGAAA